MSFPEDIDPLELRDRLNELTRSAQDRNRARYLLAISALLNLAKSGSVFSRRDMLHPPFEISAKISKATEKELSSKSWFTGFVSRLVEQKLITEERDAHAVLYCCRTADQKERVLTVALAALYEDGRALKALLWPHDPTYTEPADLPEGEPIADSGATADPALDTITELTGQLSMVATHLQGVVQGFAGLDQRLTEKFATLDGLARSLTEELQSVAALRTSLDDLLQALKDERRAQLTSILDRFIEMQSRGQSLANQLESEARKKDRLIDDLRKQLEGL